MRAHLLRWQREGYPDFHQNRTNLLLHIVSVPLFISATLSVAFNLATMQWIAAAGSFVTMIVAFALQAIGHKREKNPAIPFEGVGDVVTRIFAEQFVTFPRFFFSGAFFTALRGNAPSHTD